MDQYQLKQATLNAMSDGQYAATSDTVPSATTMDRLINRPLAGKEAVSAYLNRMLGSGKVDHSRYNRLCTIWSLWA